MIILLFLLTTVLYSEQQQVDLTIGSDAPSFVLKDMEGKFVRYKAFKGKHYILLNFWATYCKPCKIVISELHKLQKRFPAIKFFLISVDKEGESIIQPYIAKNNITLPVLIDKYHISSKAYRVKSLPSLFLIDKEGKIVFKSVGYSEDTVEKLYNFIEKLSDKIK